MRILAVAMMMLVVVLVPAPSGANHDSSDTYTTIPFGSGAIYIDDEMLPFIYRETNGFSGLQRGFDGNGDGHPGHGNADQRIF